MARSGWEVSSAQGRGGEGISRGGELLASKWGEIKSSALPHVSWNAHFRAVGGGEWGNSSGG